ncbi:cilia- and flagella-associated protein 65 isoform X3 [Nelusetta ayraudi]
MLAEDRGLEPFGSTTPRKLSTIGRDVKSQQGWRSRQQTSSQRISCYGLEMKSELVWERWEPQREFTKTLVLKNVHSKLQKLIVRPPASKVFNTLIPRSILISPGTSFSMQVTFKPQQKCEYEDNIEFQGKDGSFSVSLRATIPCYALEMPDSVLLPLCAVQNSTQASFLLRNVSKLQTYFQWEGMAPFHLSPERGLLGPNQECYITVVFQALEALVYQEHATCRFGEESETAQSSCTVLLQGVASYPYLLLRNLSSKDEKPQCDAVLDFGSVAIGQNSQKFFHIFNPSPVTASFSFSLQSDSVPLLELEFSCDVSRGTVLPGESLQASVTFTPAVVETISVEYFHLKCSGALGETRLKVIGRCEGPKVSLSSSVVDFGFVKEGGTVEQTVEIVNSSPAEAVYQMDLDGGGRHSVFSIQPASGAIRPNGKVILRAVYRPTHPIIHHRRVACLILHREPVFLDLIGTCHSKLQQPTVLKAEHLLRCYQRPDSQHSPGGMRQGHASGSEQTSVLCLLEERADSALDWSISPMQQYVQATQGCIDAVSSASASSTSHMTVAPSELVFHHKPSSSSSVSFASSQSVAITNYTGEKLSLLWTAAPNSPFSVSPPSCDLAPLKSTSFRVNYDPKQPSALHGAQLECFAYNKDQLDDRYPRPPWCLTVRVVGHYFLPGQEPPTPCCVLKPPGLVFPALGVLSYRTTVIQNRGDLPLTFCLDGGSEPALAEAVSVVPSCGLIPPGCHQILTVRTTPSEESPRQGFSVSFRLNGNKITKELKVVSVVESVSVALEGDGSLYFPPTAVCSQSQRSHRIQNQSHLPLRFQWNIPEDDQGFISVEPEAGVLQPNENSGQVWSFSPSEEKTYNLRPTLTFWPVHTPGFSESQQRLKVVGIGFKGFIEAEKSLLDVGEILVGSCKPLEVLLVNKSPCSVTFSLSVQQSPVDEDPETESSGIQLQFERATMTSQSTLLLRSTIRPQRQAQYLWTISYQTLNANGSASSPPQVLCEVQATVVYPTLMVIDVCTGGSVGKLSKVHLWKLFSLDRLNMHLRSSPTPAELTHRGGRKQSPSVFTDSKLNFDFSAAPLHSDPSVFVLIFHNPCSNPVEWAFLINQLEDGEEKELFGISPRSGTLLPGQQRAVYFSYSHHFVGPKQYPVVLKLAQGREILLNLKAMTVEKDSSYLHFPSKRHVFTSVSIADSTSPRQPSFALQVYELHNAGARPVHYQVDASVLSRLQTDNFNHPLLRCLNPKGTVLPGQTAVLEWIFSPLEAKLYQMDVPIHVENGDTAVVRFEGCGLRAPELSYKNLSSSSESVASEQSLLKRPFPGQLVFLSEDNVSFGDIPVCSRSSRLLFLINLSHSNTLHFTWNKSHQQLVQIKPDEGTLSPGETVLFVLTFISSEHPTCYQLDVFCQILQEDELVQYKNALQRWEKEKERQQTEFIITDKKLLKTQPILEEDEHVPSVRQGPPIRKYKTLPPIYDGTELVSTLFTKSTRAERRVQREAARLWKRPEPPQPFVLQLWVTAHSHSLPDYLSHFPKQFQKLHRYLQSLNSEKPKPSNLDRPAAVSSSTLCPEKHIVGDILTSLLWCAIDDPVFMELLNATPCKPIVYMAQQPGPSSPSSKPAPSSPSQRVAERGKQRRPVDTEATAESLEKLPQTETRRRATDLPGDTYEHFLLGITQSLMMEAVRGELVLTAHPHTNILPSSHRSTPKSSDREESGSLEVGQEPAGTDVPLSSSQ